MNPYNQLAEILVNAQSDFEKFYEKDRIISGSRAKKALMSLRKLSSQVCKEIAEKKKEIKLSKLKDTQK